jgi:hypothetical protein
LEIALEKGAHSSWKNWVLENPEKNPRTGELAKHGLKKLGTVGLEEDISTKQLQELT